MPPPLPQAEDTGSEYPLAGEGPRDVNAALDADPFLVADVYDAGARRCDCCIISADDSEQLVRSHSHGLQSTLNKALSLAYP